MATIMASSQNIPPAPAISFPLIDRVNIGLYTQLSQGGDWRSQNFSLEQRFIAGWDRVRAMQMASAAGKPGLDGRIKSHRDYYGGGVHFLRDKCGYMNTDNDSTVEILYENPVPIIAAWGRFYSNMRNCLYFEVDDSFTDAVVTNGIQDTVGTYRVQPGFQVTRYYSQVERQFLESTAEHMIRRPFCQLLRVDGIIRKPGKVK